MTGSRTPDSALYPLDDPVGSALRGPHAHFAERRGRILRYPPSVTPWLALPDRPEAADWADAAALAGPGGIVTVTAFRERPPEDWEVVFDAEGVQLVDVAVEAAPCAEAVRLGPADVPEMLDLVARTRPGPFETRTIELGTYLGVRRDGVLVAMAGERLRPPGWSEISGVCTDESVRGQGLMRRTRAGRRPRDPGARRNTLPARRRVQHQRRPALRVAGLRPPPPHAVPLGARPGEPAGTRTRPRPGRRP